MRFLIRIFFFFSCCFILHSDGPTLYWVYLTKKKSSENLQFCNLTQRSRCCTIVSVTSYGLAYAEYLKRIKMLVWKEPFAEVLQIRCSWKFGNLYKKTLVLGVSFYYNKNYNKRDSNTGVFLWILRSFLKNIPLFVVNKVKGQIFFGKFDTLCLLVTLVLRFSVLPYYGLIDVWLGNKYLSLSCTKSRKVFDIFAIDFKGSEMSLRRRQLNFSSYGPNQVYFLASQNNNTDFTNKYFSFYYLVFS